MKTHNLSYTYISLTQVNSMYKQPASVMNGKLMHDYSGKINALQVYYLHGTSAQLTYTAILTEKVIVPGIVVSASVKFIFILLQTNYNI